MFRHLIPLLANDYHVIAPDHLGFGLSDAPAADAFNYTFDALTDVDGGPARHLGVRLTRCTSRTTALRSAGGWLCPAPTRSARSSVRTATPTKPGSSTTSGRRSGPIHRRRARRRRSRSRLPVAGCDPLAVPDRRDPTRRSSTRRRGITITRLLSRPGNDEVQLALFRDYATNPPLYPAVHAYFRTQQRPALGCVGAWRRDLRPRWCRGVRGRPARTPRFISSTAATSFSSRRWTK